MDNQKIKRFSLPIIGLILLVSGFTAGRWGTPARVEEKERLVLQDRIVEAHMSAYVGRTSTETKLAVAWKTKEVIRPDGTIEREAEGKLDSTMKATTEEKSLQIDTHEEDIFTESEKIKVVQESEKSLAAAILVGADKLSTDGALIAGQLEYRPSEHIVLLGQLQTHPTKRDMGALIGVGFSF